MGHAPDTVNDAGDVLSDESKAYLYGDTRPGGQEEHPGQSKDVIKQMLFNWMHGYKPDPNQGLNDLEKSGALKGVKEIAGMGGGAAGLFGFGKAFGGGPEMKPLDLGSPSNRTYSASGTGNLSIPPLPKIKPF